MPRRASSGISGGQVVGLVIGIIFVVAILFVSLMVLFGGGIKLGGSGGGNGRPAPSANTELNVTEYLNNANALRGNAYRLTGKVDQQLKWTLTRGRLFSIVATSGNASSPVPVLVPQRFSHLNIEKGTELTFVVEVSNDGVLVARDIIDG